MCKGKIITRRTAIKMNEMMANGSAGVGYSLTYDEAIYLFRYNFGNTFRVDGRVLNTVTRLGHEMASNLNDLKVHGHMTTADNGRIYDGWYDFESHGWSWNPVAIARAILTPIASLQHGDGLIFEIEYRYEDYHL